MATLYEKRDKNNNYVNTFYEGDVLLKSSGRGWTGSCEVVSCTAYDDMGEVDEGTNDVVFVWDIRADDMRLIEKLFGTQFAHDGHAHGHADSPEECISQFQTAIAEIVIHA